MGTDPFEEGLANAPKLAPAITQDDPFESGLASAAVTGAPPKGQSNNQTWGQTAADVAKSGASGVEQAVAGYTGLPGNIDRLSRHIANWLLDKSGIPHADPTQGAEIFPSSEQVSSVLPGSDYKPKTTSGEVAQFAGNMVPNMAAGPENMLVRAGTNVLLPALGEEGGKKTADALGAPSLETPLEIAGAVAGGMSPNLLARGVTPFPATAERVAARQALQNEGVNISAGQLSGNRGVMAAESELGGGGARNEANIRQFTRAVLRRAGINSDTADPATIDGAFTRIGNQFDVLGARNNLTVDRQMRQGMTNITNRAAPSDMALVQRHISDIEAVPGYQQGQPLPGTAYQNLRSNLTDDIRAANDYTRKNTLFGLRNVLDDAMERSMRARGSTADLAAWQEARRQYRNMLVINKATGGTSSTAGQGFITPAKLTTADQAIAGRKAYNRGQSPFNDLARAGNSVMTSFPDSGTSTRAWTRLVSAGLGGLLGAHFGLPLEGGIGGGLLAEAAGPWAVGRAINSPFAQRYLSNQLLPNRLPPGAGRRAGIVAALTSPFLRKPPSQ